MLYPLYIDPGTGSMLFSIVIGAAATLYFLGRALVIRLKTAFSGGRVAKADGDRHKFVIFSEGKQYWNIFMPVLEEFEKRQQDLLYLASSRDDPVFERTFKFVKSEFIGEGNRGFARLNLLSADFVLMTTPGLDVYQLKRSKMVKHYSHVLHAATDATMYRMFGFDYFDSILLTGDYQKDDIRFLEKIRDLPEKQLVTVGCTYLDVAAEKIKQIPQGEDHPYTVLVSPSWGPSALLARYGEKLLDPLVESGFKVIVRPHPQSKKSEGPMLDRLMERYKDTASLEWDYERENIYALVKADIMIGDYSGIIFDYIFLCDKPVIYVNYEMDLRPYDAHFLTGELWQFKTCREIGVEIREEDFASIKDVITRVSDNAQLQERRRKAKDEAWQRRGEAGKCIADFMIETAEKLTPPS
jgi:hypothetical protein